MIKFLDFKEESFRPKHVTLQEDAISKWIEAYNGFDRRISLTRVDEIPCSILNDPKLFASVRSLDFPELPTIMLEVSNMELPFPGIAVDVDVLLNNNNFKQVNSYIYAHLIADGIVDAFYVKSLAWFAPEGSQENYMPLSSITPTVMILDDATQRFDYNSDSHISGFVDAVLNPSKRYYVVQKDPADSSEIRFIVGLDGSHCGFYDKAIRLDKMSTTDFNLALSLLEHSININPIGRYDIF